MHYDDWVYDRGLENEEWVHDRWGDDDDWDDDYDDNVNTSRKEEKNNMYEKKFFTEMNIKEGFNDTDLMKIQKVLNLKNIIAINSLDGLKYTIFVQKDIKNLANAFGINLEDISCENILDANEKIFEYSQVIAVELNSLIETYFKNKKSFMHGNIDFIDLYEDKKTLNEMVAAINQYYGDNSFETLSSICKNFAFNIDLSKLKNEINENISKKNELDREYDEYKYENYNKKTKELYSLLQSIENSNCFSRETFAMLYIRLIKYVEQEKAINDFLKLFEHSYQNLFEKTIIKEENE